MLFPSLRRRHAIWMVFAAGCFSVCFALPIQAEDGGKFSWPQWRGPQRDGVSRETGLLKEWPKEGPRVLWQIEDVGVAYSSLAVVGDRIYTQGDLDGVEHTICVSVKDGSRIWAVQPEPVRK